MKVLVTGCRGQLGIELKNQMSLLNSSGRLYEIIETDLHNLDITDRNEVFRFVKEHEPEVIINCAAYTNVDACETDEINAFRVNAVGPQNLSAAAFKVGAKIIQISTDYVFDGSGDTPRREYDPVNPQTVYGKSKALGEKLVRETNPRHFIVRTAWLYGEGKNFIRTILGLAQEKEELNVVADQFGSPTSTVDLAGCIINLMSTESYGTYHATCEGSCSWFELAKEVFSLMNIGVKVNPITTAELNRPAKRPKYSVLENFMLNLIELNNFRDWKVALKEYLEGL